MKKTFLFSALAIAAMSASAQQAIQQPSLCDNWSIGVNGGVTTPLVDHPFFGSMRGMFGLNVEKKLTPVFGLGAEGFATINTSSFTGKHSSTAIDRSYVGAYGSVDLMNLFGGYQCETRPFNIDVIAGAGWGHDYYTSSEGKGVNFMATKAGLNFNFNVSDDVTITLQPSVFWNMTGANVAQTSAAYDARRASFNLTAGVTYHIGGRSFDCVVPLDPAMVDALNGQVNALRAEARLR